MQRKKPVSHVSDFLTVPELGALLKISRYAIYDMVNSGALPHIRMGAKGGALRFHRPAIDAWIAAGCPQTQKARA